jgi:hypothetical protein
VLIHVGLGPQWDLMTMSVPSSTVNGRGFRVASALLGMPEMRRVTFMSGRDGTDARWMRQSELVASSTASTCASGFLIAALSSPRHPDFLVRKEIWVSDPRPTLARRDRTVWRGGKPSGLGSDLNPRPADRFGLGGREPSHAGQYEYQSPQSREGETGLSGSPRSCRGHACGR